MKHQFSKEQLIATISSGMTARAIARQFHCDSATIRYWARKYEIPTYWSRKPVSYPLPQKEKLESLLHNGCSTYKISKDLGVSQATVIRWLRRYGLKSLWARPRTEKKCLNCGALVIGRRMFCNSKCRWSFGYKEKIATWKSGAPMVYRNGRAPNFIRRYLIAIRGEKCEKCGWSERNPKSGKVPIQIEHKDGNYLNNGEENLEILCPNCHSLTPTFMGLNRGNGRVARRKVK